MSAIRILSVALLAALLAAPVAPARAAEQGATSLDVSIAPGRQLDQTYTVVSGRYGYYFVPDFDASIGIEAWRGKDPALYKIVPQLRYVYPANPRVQPYVALFVTRTLYDDLPDRNTYGGRVGFLFNLNRGARLGVGVVHERIEGCDSDTYHACRQNYPEVGLHFAF
jgi:hypothetical protein